VRLGHKIIGIIALARIKPTSRLKQPAIQFFGGDGEEVTPVPIPNTEVKLFSADGTARATVWESRTPPKISIKARPTLLSGSDGLFGFSPPRENPYYF
jgi:hypothetical protein